MAQVLRCCSLQSSNQPYIGVDQKCSQPAIFCLQHSPHKNSQGLMHQMLPLKHFKKTLQQKKFAMNQKIGCLIDQYNNLMDALIQQIRELKLRKNIQFSMLWLRQLAKDQQEYQLMRQIYRMDFKDLTCALVHSIYFKIVHNQILEKKSVRQINCYKGIAEILQHLSQQKQTRSFLSKKISQIQGILENGEILKRALPDKLVFKQNIKQVLLQSPNADCVDIKYNKCKLTTNSRQYISIFSKYPMVPHVLYHINFNTKYTNVMIGICTQALIESSIGNQSRVQLSQNDNSQLSNQQSALTDFDKHYSKDSLVFNCTNGCVYKDGMFESGSNSLTKGQKQLVLKMRITSTNEFILMLGKNVLCRQKLDNLLNRNKKEDTKFFLHVLLRTEGDSFDVDRDKDISGDQLPARMDFNNTQANSANSFANPRQNINFQEIKRRNQEQVMNVNNIKEQIMSGKGKQTQSLNRNENQSYSYEFKHLDSRKLIGKLNKQSAPALRQQRSQQQLRQQAVKKQIKRLQDRKKQQNIQNKAAPPSFKKLNENQKQQKINEIIKKQRIDKILNELKSKPSFSSGSSQNPIVARKLRQIQQRKNSNQNLNLVNQRQKNRQRRQQNEQMGQFNDSIPGIRMLQPSTVINGRYNQQQQQYDNDSSFQGGNSSIFNSPMMKSSQINPLLILQKQKQKQSSFNNYTQNNAQKYKQVQSPMVKISSPQQQSDQDNYRKNNFNINNNFNNKLHPSQKIFKLDDDQSYQFDQGISDNYQPLNGGVTPIDKINQFQFAKKSIKLKSSLQNNHNNQLQKNNSPSTFLLPVLQQAQQRGDQSHIIQDYDINNMEIGSPPIYKNDKQVKIPQLKHSHFSKMTSKSNLNQSNMSSSFGTDMHQIINKNNNQQRLVPRNPMDRMALLESIIDIKSQNKSINGDNMDIFHIGNVLTPKVMTHPDESSKVDISFEHSENISDRSLKNVVKKNDKYRKMQNKQEHDQSIIDIRGTLMD